MKWQDVCAPAWLYGFNHEEAANLRAAADLEDGLAIALAGIDPSGPFMNMPWSGSPGKRRCLQTCHELSARRARDPRSA